MRKWMTRKLSNDNNNNNHNSERTFPPRSSYVVPSSECFTFNDRVDDQPIDWLILNWTEWIAAFLIWIEYHRHRHRHRVKVVDLKLHSWFFCYKLLSGNETKSSKTHLIMVLSWFCSRLCNLEILYLPEDISAMREPTTLDILISSTRLQDEVPRQYS